MMKPAMHRARYCFFKKGRWIEYDGLMILSPDPLGSGCRVQIYPHNEDVLEVVKKAFIIHEKKHPLPPVKFPKFESITEAEFILHLNEVRGVNK